MIVMGVRLQRLLLKSMVVKVARALVVAAVMVTAAYKAHACFIT